MILNYLINRIFADRFINCMLMMSSYLMEEKTHYAPASRSAYKDLLIEKELVESQKLFTELFGSLTGVSAIINNNRQIVFANTSFLELMGLKTLDPILGKRPGEVVSCINAEMGIDGCGTSEACRYCGAVNAILESQKTNRKSTREARISSEIEGKLINWDLKITSSPIKLDGHKFYALTLQDISNEKKLMALERVFFHDLLNTAGGLHGLLKILKMGVEPEEMYDLINKSEEVSQIILEEILSYKGLRAAEEGDIVVKIEKANSIELLKSVIDRISFHEVGQNKSIVISEHAASIDFETDKLLLSRVMINLLKNALEATDINGLVSIQVEDHNDKLVFSVINTGVMPEEIRVQIFQRSFSTKGRNRGIGTYSARLMTENYLKGKVSFISNEDEGTIFKVELNKSWPST